MADLAALRDAPLPVPTFEQAVPHLRRPFTAEAVRWKTQTGTLVVPYIDARLVIERLNLVIPRWAATYERDGKLLWCHLTIDGITRSDVGSGYEGKGLISDSLKRAAVQFGVGVCNYALRKLWLKVEDGHLKEEKSNSSKTRLVLTRDGELHLRRTYAEWLPDIEEKFGPVLDHGDVEGAIGDPEAEAPAEEAVDDSPQPIDDERAKTLRGTALEVYSTLTPAQRKGLTKAAVKRTVDAATSHEELETLIAELTERAG